MQTLSYGFFLPNSGDKGSALWTALEQNISKTNNHTHNGTDSAVLPASVIGSAQSPIPASGWATYTNAPVGHYRQLVTMAPGYTFDLKNVSLRTAAGEYVYPKIVKNDGTSFYVYSTDNTLDLVANYGG